MSKQFSRGGGGGGRRGGMGVSNNSIGIKKNSSHIGGYKSRRVGSGAPAEEKQRQSVFDRLGTRKVNSGNSSSHYQSGSGGDGLNRTKKSPKSPERKVTSSGGRQVSDRGPRGRTRSRSRSRGSRTSRSPVPKHRVKPSTSATGTSRKANVKSVVAVSKKDRSQRKPSPSSRHHDTSKLSKVKVKSHKEGQTSPKHRGKAVASSKGKKLTSGSGQVKKGKRHGHGHTPSVSSDESSSQGGESSSTTSSRSSSSSVTDESGSSSSEGSSDSDSSVPSVKIKHTKKGKEKEKSKKVKRKIQDHSDEWEQSKKEQMSQKNKIRNDVISISSPHSKSHPTSGKRGSSEARGDTREREFGDRRSTAAAKIGRTDRESHSRSRDTHNFSRAGESGSVYGERHSQANRSDRFEDSSRKRRLSGDNYDGPNKRTRIPTPPPGRLKNVGRRTRSPSPTGRIHDSHMIQSSNRERTPLASMRDRPRVTSPLSKRPPFEDTRRGEIRRDIKQQRYVSPAPFMKSKESERDRDRPFSASFGSAFNSSNYNRDERHRERFAPSRETSQPQGPRERIVPPQHSDRRNTSSRDVEPTGRRAPLLPFPADVKPIYQYQNKNIGGGNLTPNEAYNKRGPGPSTFRKRSPLIVKTKEALIEKYEEIRQSRVDMWVDETVRGGPPKRSPTPTSTSKAFPDDLIIPSPLDKEKRRSTSIGSGNGEQSKEIEEEELSDFSDDADDILTKEVVVPVIPKEIESESTPKVKVLHDITMTKDVDSDTAKVSSSSLREEVVQTRHDSMAQVQVQVSTNLTSTEARTIRSQSQSQTDDDLLERMDFEEISDEELGEGENKIGIVDALGVDWSSLVCRERTEKVEREGDGGVAKDSASAARKLKDKWSAANILKQVGLSKQLAGDALFEKVFSKIQDLEERNGVAETTTKEELEYPNWRRKRLERKHLLDDIGVGPYSRALSSRRDLVVRRYLLNMIPKSLVSLDMLHQTPAPRSQLEVDYIRSIPAKCNI